MTPRTPLDPWTWHRARLATDGHACPECAEVLGVAAPGARPAGYLATLEEMGHADWRTRLERARRELAAAECFHDPRHHDWIEGPLRWTGQAIDDQGVYYGDDPRWVHRWLRNRVELLPFGTEVLVGPLHGYRMMSERRLGGRVILQAREGEVWILWMRRVAGIPPRRLREASWNPPVGPTSSTR